MRDAQRRDGKGRGGTAEDATGKDEAGRESAGRGGQGWGGKGRDGAGEGGTGIYGTGRERTGHGGKCGVVSLFGRVHSARKQNTTGKDGMEREGTVKAREMCKSMCAFLVSSCTLGSTGKDGTIKDQTWGEVRCSFLFW